MKITFITTVDTNVGDDFVREGIKYLLESKIADPQYSYINKHFPISSRAGFERIRNHKLAKYLDKILPFNAKGDKILGADLIIWSGAPAYWCHDIGGSHAASSDWYRDLIKRRYVAKGMHVPLLNIAAGTCQRYHSDGSEMLKCEKDVAYIKEFYHLSKITTVRDELAQNILGSLGLVVPKIPCASIFAAERNNIKSGGDEYVALNYMTNGAHYTFGQQIDSEKWFTTFRHFYHYLVKMENVVFVCHNDDEVRQAKLIDSRALIFHSHNFVEYIRFYSKAKFGILNRVHGAFMLASLGKPSVVIGNDTRALMAHELGLKSYFVNDIDVETLIQEYGRLQKEKSDYQEKISAIRNSAFDSYMYEFERLSF